MNSLENDLKEASEYHGHLCSGQILGVRMARLGLNLLKIENPKKYRDLIVYVESDRCLSDAIGTVTGSKVGKRTLKVKNFGKMATTFYDINSKKAFRIYKKFDKYPEKGGDIIEFFSGFSDDELFDVDKVKVNIRKEDLPGPPIKIEICNICGEEILDGNEVIENSEIFCKSCKGEKYYETI